MPAVLIGFQVNFFFPLPGNFLISSLFSNPALYPHYPTSSTHSTRKLTFCCAERCRQGDLHLFTIKSPIPSFCALVLCIPIVYDGRVTLSKLISPCKLWTVLPLILSGFTPQILISFSSVITFSFSTGTFSPAYKHALLLMFQNPFLVLIFPFSHHLFLYLSSQQNYEKSCMNLHLLIFTHSSTHEEWKLPTFY